MGTPSLLGYEKSNGKYYAQYMQFDGYPSTKGKEFYESILTTLLEAPSYFINKKSKPNAAFFKRIKHFLDNYMYASAHSFNSNWETINWEGAGNYWYLFDKNGNFISFDAIQKWKCVIPWEFTRGLTQCFGKGPDLNIPYDESKLTPFWDCLNHFEKIEQRNLPVPEMNLEVAETLSFPGLGNEGWRKCGHLLIKNLIDYDNEKHKITKLKPINITSMFYGDGKERNRKSYRINISSEYLRVRDCPLDQLPLLINNLEREDAQELLEKRLSEK